jgi:tRNA uridine 5-carbamoylmethylation protein Kti12
MMGEKLTRDALVQILAEHKYVMLTGSDSSGKTTLAKALKSKHQFKRLSLDRMRKKEPDLLLTGDLDEEFYRRLTKALRFYRVVDDNLNHTSDSRLRALRILRTKRIENFVIVHLDVPLETCLAWNAKRSDPSETEWLKIKWRTYQVNLPESSEGPVIRVRPLEGGGYEVFR